MSRPAPDLREDLVARPREVVEAAREEGVLRGAVGVRAGPGDVALGDAHGVDPRQVFPRDDLAEVPAESAVGAGEVVDALELVRLVEDDVELVVLAREGVGEDAQRLAGRAGPGQEKGEKFLTLPGSYLDRFPLDVAHF